MQEGQLEIGIVIEVSAQKGTMLLPSMLRWSKYVIWPKSASVEQMDNLCMVYVRAWEGDVFAN